MKKILRVFTKLNSNSKEYEKVLSSSIIAEGQFFQSDKEVNEWYDQQMGVEIANINDDSKAKKVFKFGVR